MAAVASTFLLNDHANFLEAAQAIVLQAAEILGGSIYFYEAPKDGERDIFPVVVASCPTIQHGTLASQEQVCVLELALLAETSVAAVGNVAAAVVRTFGIVRGILLAEVRSPNESTSAYPMTASVVSSPNCSSGHSSLFRAAVSHGACVLLPSMLLWSSVLGERLEKIHWRDVAKASTSEPPQHKVAEHSLSVSHVNYSRARDNILQVGSTWIEPSASSCHQVDDCLQGPNFSIELSAQSTRSFVPLLSDEIPEQRHLILNFDINKTILMRDKVSNKGVKEIVNEVLADTVWGSTTDGRWTPQIKTPCVHRPSPNGCNLISYNEWLSQEHPGSKNKKMRNQKAGVFTDEGEPGSCFAEITRSLASKLLNPDGSPVQIIPAFFELVLSLKREKRSFTIVFRTFGEDLDSVVEEFNTFCKGNHPLHPGVRLDGSDGEADYTVKPGDPEKCGIFYRDDDTLAIVMGTWESPEREKEPSLNFYDNIPNAIVKSCTMQDLYSFLTEKCRRPSTMALRDYFPFWKKLEMQPHGGKLVFYSLCPSVKEHWIFFDDNIRYDDAYIVDARPAQVDLRVPYITLLMKSHILRAEPLESIGNKDYFVNHVATLEAGYDRRVKARQKLRRCLLLVRATSILRIATSKIDKPEYDPWEGQRLGNELLSLPTSEDAEH